MLDLIWYIRTASLTKSVCSSEDPGVEPQLSSVSKTSGGPHCMVCPQVMATGIPQVSCWRPLLPSLLLEYGHPIAYITWASG